MPINQKTASHWSTGLTTASILLGIGAGLSSLFTGGASLAAYGAWMGVSEAAAAAASGLTYGGVATGLGASLSGILGSSAALQQHQKGAGGQLGFAIGQGVLSLATMGLSNAVSGTAKMASRALGVAGAAGAAYGVGQEIKGIASGNIQLKGKGHGWERLDVFNAVSGTLGVMAAGGNEMLGKKPTPANETFEKRIYQVLSRGNSALDAPLIHGPSETMNFPDQQPFRIPNDIVSYHVGVRSTTTENDEDFQHGLKMMNEILPHVAQGVSIQARSIRLSWQSLNGLYIPNSNAILVNPVLEKMNYSTTITHEIIHSLLNQTGFNDGHGPEFYVAHNDYIEKLQMSTLLSPEQVLEMAQQTYAFNQNPYEQIDPYWTTTKTRILNLGNADML